MEFISIDLETTGLSRKSCSIIEVGAVLFRQGVVINTYSSLINFNGRIPGRIKKLTGIDEIMLQNAPTLRAVLKELKCFIGERIVVAHNAGFDIGFLVEKSSLVGLKFSIRYICSLSVARNTLVHLSSHNLETCARELSLHSPTHRALDDAITAGHLFDYCVNQKGWPEFSGLVKTTSVNGKKKMPNTSISDSNTSPFVPEIGLSKVPLREPKTKCRRREKSVKTKDNSIYKETSNYIQDLIDSDAFSTIEDLYDYLDFNKWVITRDGISKKKGMNYLSIKKHTQAGRVYHRLPWKLGH